MFKDVTVNLAMFLKIVIYILIFTTSVIVYRFLVRKLYVNRIARKIRNEILKLFSEHYIEFGFKSRKEFEVKLISLNKELKIKYNLNRYPINWYSESLISYKSYVNINERFVIRNININKNILFYKIRINRCESWKNGIKYKDSVKENRDSKLAELIQIKN